LATPNYCTTPWAQIKNIKINKIKKNKMKTNIWNKGELGGKQRKKENQKLQI